MQTQTRVFREDPNEIVEMYRENHYSVAVKSMTDHQGCLCPITLVLSELGRIDWIEQDSADIDTEAADFFGNGYAYGFMRGFDEPKETFSVALSMVLPESEDVDRFRQGWEDGNLVRKTVEEAGLTVVNFAYDD